MAGRIRTNQPLPYVVLTTVASESGSWEYEIRTSLRTGVTYCTCRGFGTHKHCKHMDAYKANPVIAVPTPAMMPPPQRKTPGTVLRDELALLGLKISEASANAISLRVLAMGGKVASMPDATGPEGLNQANIRRIILPD